MHLLLTDRLVCPRCGPDFGLILLATRTRDRRVYDGELGCANCRERYAIADGFCDLRLPPRGPRPLPEPEPSSGSSIPDTAALAAMVGVREGPAHVLVSGGSVERASALAEAIDDLEVVVVEPVAGGWPERDGVSRIAVSTASLPLRSGAVRVAVIGGSDLATWGDEAIRVVQRLGRVVVIGPLPDSRAELERRGLSIMAEDERAIVANVTPSTGVARSTGAD